MIISKIFLFKNSFLSIITNVAKVYENNTQLEILVVIIVILKKHFYAISLFLKIIFNLINNIDNHYNFMINSPVDEIGVIYFF